MYRTAHWTFHRTSPCSSMCVHLVTLPRCINWQGYAAPNKI